MAVGYSPQLPLRHDSIDGYYVLTKTFKEAVKQNLKMLVLTAPGERMMDPNFGIGVRNFLFENVNSDVSLRLRQRIEKQRARYMPYIDIRRVDMLSLNDDTIVTVENLPTLGIRIFYFIKTAGSTDVLDLTTLRG